MSWPWNPDQRSLKVIEKIVYDFLLVFFSNIVPEMHRFWDIRLRKCRDLENQVRGPSRSLEISPFDRAHMTSYWCSIVTMAVSPVKQKTRFVWRQLPLALAVEADISRWCKDDVTYYVFDELTLTVALCLTLTTLRRGEWRIWAVRGPRLNDRCAPVANRQNATREVASACI